MMKIEPCEKLVGQHTIGTGEYGVVDAGKIQGADIVVKKSTDTRRDADAVAEYKIHKSLPANPHIPRAHKQERCCGMLHTYIDLVKGTTIEKWLRGPTAQTNQLRSVIFQVLHTLSALGLDFRHNDLHLDNVLISPDPVASIAATPYNVGGSRRAMLPPTGVKAHIIDFGLARYGSIVAPITASGVHRETHGIYAGNSPSYDIHLFLNSVYRRTNSASTRAFISRVFRGDARYKGHTTQHVVQFRLRPGHGNGIMSFREIFADPYFAEFFVSEPPVTRKRDNIVAIIEKREDNAPKKREDIAVIEKREDIAVIAVKKREDIAIAAKKRENAAITKKKREDNAIAKKKREDNAIAKKKREDNAIAKKKRENAAIAKKKRENAAAAKNNNNGKKTRYVDTKNRPVFKSSKGSLYIVRGDKKVYAFKIANPNANVPEKHLPAQKVAAAAPRGGAGPSRGRIATRMRKLGGKKDPFKAKNK